MMRLHTDWAYLEQEFGCSIRDRFLMAVRSLDNPKAVTPFMLEKESVRFGLFMHVEKGNVEAARLPPDITPIYYRPYFTFEESETAHASLRDAIGAIAGGERHVLIDRRTPLVIAQELASTFAIDAEEGSELGTVSLRRVACADVVERLGKGRPAAARAALRLLERSPVREQLAPYLERHEDVRFSALDAALARAKLDGLVVTSALNLQEIAGVPVGKKQRPIGAFYAPGEKHVWVLENGHAPDSTRFGSPAEALRHAIPTGRLGVEEEDVPIELARALQLQNRDQQPASNLVRRWRDENTLPDAPYYIIATRITRHAIEAALAFTREALQRKSLITEMDPYGIYLRSMREFTSAALSGAKVARTLTNFHTGARTIFPANAAPYPVNEEINTLKIDAGCLLFTADGILLGCSDIARTLPVSDTGRELYDVFIRGVRETLIPSACVGRSGDAVHALGVNAVWGRKDKIKANPLFVDLARPTEEYARDVGHLLGKNNLAHLRLVRGDHQVLKEGMIACCEYQWPLQGHAIAYEDTCLVTPTGGLNITSDET